MTGLTGQSFPFSGGGVSPAQGEWANYTMNENMLNNASQFSSGPGGQGGIPMSTGKTQADAGARMGMALQTQQLSQEDTAALTSALNTQKSQLTSGIGSLGTLLGGLGGI
jgi:hypothetical protein